MIRAILLARAIAAAFRGLRSSNCTSQAAADLLPGLAQRITASAPTTSSCRNLSRQNHANIVRTTRSHAFIPRHRRANRAVKYPREKSGLLVLPEDQG